MGGSWSSALAVMGVHGHAPSQRMDCRRCKHCGGRCLRGNNIRPGAVLPDMDGDPAQLVRSWFVISLDSADSPHVSSIVLPFVHVLNGPWQILRIPAFVHKHYSCLYI